MTDPTLAYQAAAYTALKTAMTAAGHSGQRVVVDPEHAQSFPYIVIGQATAISFPTKTTEGAELTFTAVAWGSTHTEAQTAARTALDALTDRDAPIEPTGFVNAGQYFDFRGPVLTERAPGTGEGAYYGVPVRVRVRLVEE